jgi:hypothetical protein
MSANRKQRRAAKTNTGDLRVSIRTSPLILATFAEDEWLRIMNPLLKSAKQEFTCFLNCEASGIVEIRSLAYGDIMMYLDLPEKDLYIGFASEFPTEMRDAGIVIRDFDSTSEEWEEKKQLHRAMYN